VFRYAVIVDVTVASPPVDVVVDTTVDVWVDLKGTGSRMPVRVCRYCVLVTVMYCVTWIIEVDLPRRGTWVGQWRRWVEQITLDTTDALIAV
jgi:hypothetical protein